MQDASSFRILHIFREANRLTDYKANAVLQCNFQWIFEADLDFQCKIILYADAYGFQYHCL